MSENSFRVKNSLLITPVSARPSNPSNGEIIYNTSNNNFEKYVNGAWVTDGAAPAPASTSIITNGSADDASSSIFVPYLNTAQRLPVSGTGGSPTVTTSLTSTNPLLGTKSFLLTKPASNTQGQGWAIPFTVDLGNRAKSLKISVDYIVNSGTFVAGTSSTDSDIIWYIFDATSSQLIEPSNIKMFSNSATLSDTFEATFQTSATGSSYRLLAHCATTSALAYEIKVDNVTVTPQVAIYGTPITDLITYPLTIGATVTAPTLASNATVNIARYRREGDVALITYSVAWPGTGAGATAGSGTYLFPIPPGLSIDLTKQSNINNGSSASSVGYGHSTISGVGNFLIAPYFFDATRLAIVTSSNGQTIGSSFGALTGNGGAFTFTATVPIQGWGSSVRMSEPGDTRLVSFSGSGTGSTQALTAGVTNISATVVKDSHGAWTGSTFVVPVAGDYSVGAFLYAPSNFTGQLHINGTFFKYFFYSVAFAGGSGQIIVPNLKVGDILSVRSSGSITLAADPNQSISISRISSPQAIAASEIIAGSYLIPSHTTTTTVNIGTRVYDTHNIVAANTITIPSSGIYRFNVNRTLAASVAGNMNIYVNAVDKGIIVTNNLAQVISGARSLQLNAGDLVTFNNNGTSTNITAGFIDFEKIK